MFAASYEIMHVHFMGVAGTAMGPLAVMAAGAKMKVSGSDHQIYPPMSDLIKNAGIDFFEGYSAKNLQPKPDLVVVGNAISRGNAELEEVLNQKIDYTSMAEFVYKYFIKGHKSIVVTGTHGKTTVTSMLAWIAQTAEQSPGYLIAGAAKNFLVPSRSCQSAKSPFIIEGDEYDNVYYDKRSKFFQYRPDFLIINNLEFDHADIFSSIEEIKVAFRRLVNMVPSTGKVFANGDDENVREVVSHAFCEVIFFGVGKQNDFVIEENDGLGNAKIFYENDSISIANNASTVGLHNLRNWAAAVCAARHLNIGKDKITKAIKSFEGVKRRMELIAQKGDLFLYDDFAHHPSAIRSTLYALRERHPKHRLVVLLDPRSNSMVRTVFQEELIEALSLANVFMCNEIYRKEKYKVEERLNVSKLIDILNAKNIQSFFTPTENEILTRLQGIVQQKDVIVLFSNGAFFGLREKIPKLINSHSFLD